MAKRTEPTTSSHEPDSPDPDADVAALPYEQARDELMSIVDRLESGQVGLEESVALWRRGEALAAHCTTWLDQAQTLLASMDESELSDEG